MSRGGRFKDMTNKFDIEKNLDHNDFRLCRIKIKVILIQQACVDAIKDETNMSTLLS